MKKKTGIKSFVETFKEEAEQILKDGPTTLVSIQSRYKDLFTFESLSSAEQSFSDFLNTTGPNAINPSLDKILPTARDLLSSTISDISKLERFIALSVPAMEDGNNFGVSVQQVVSKFLKDTKESLEKKRQEICKYYANRAEAVEKLNLPKVTSTQTKTESKSEGTGKDGPENKTSSDVVNKEESTSTQQQNVFRMKHVLALDVQCYVELRDVVSELLDTYTILLDTVEKNKDKLSMPKGSAGGNAMSMF